VLAALLANGRRLAAAGDVVAYASDVTTISGNWSRVADSTAAGGQDMTSADYGWSATAEPLASPNDYFEIPFTASANTAYHVWVRMRATGDSKWNDSVWLQFGDAQTASGSSIYQIGTTSGLLLNLEPCSNCGTSGWGWVDGAYWLSQINVVQFASSGTHTLRIQIREDGVQVDQVVLSPSTWLQSSPGQPSGDSTIIPKNGDAAASASSSGGSSVAYFGSPLVVPGTIQAEAFDNGGEGVSYHDTTAGNSGGAFRNTDVDIETASGGGYDVGWIDAGEWLNYTVNVSSAGSYTAQIRVAGFGGTMHIRFSASSNVSTSVSVPSTGGWQAWTTVNVPVTLVAGIQQMTLLFDTGGYNVDWVTVSSGAPDSGGSGGGASSSVSTPYTGSPATIPGTIEAELFDNGGEGVAYHDTTPGNSGGALRNTDVDIEAASPGGYDVGWIDAGEWLQYTVNVVASGTYTVQFRVASLGQGGTFHLEMNGTNVSGSLTIPDTGGWQNWQTVSATVQLSSGTEFARIVIDSSGTSAAGNIDRFQFSSGSSGGDSSGVGLSGSGGSDSSSGGGTTTTVQPGEDLQGAIDRAQPGDTILLVPGGVYEGGLILRAKTGSAFITIRSAAADSSLPGSTTRITPASSSLLPKIQGGTAGLPAMMTESGAHHWRLQFLELVDTWPYGDILQLGDGSGAQTSLAQVAHDLVVDRVYIHGVPGQEQKRGIALNSASTTITNSYIADIRLTNGDSQAIAAWNGPGPFTITNNYLEATGENILFGGADPAIQNLVPSDIVFRGNTVSKQASWRSSGYAVKNLIEMKNVQRMVIDGNVVEYNWAGGQSGYAIVLTPRNQDGGAPWSVVQQITITNNVVRHISGVLNILGTDYLNPSQPLTDVTFRNNLVVDLSAANWGGAGQLVLFSGGNNVTLDHNTVFTDGTSAVYADGNPVYGFTFTNNIIPDNAWAVMGASASEGNGTLAAFFPGAVCQRNIIIGAASSMYPTVNYFPATIAQVGFVDPGGNFRLSSTSPYAAAATDGSAIGANIDALDTATGASY
jgi:hypothetical protein